jgi:leader peptidase (prepilin peptidase)/N-methyltransferase
MVRILGTAFAALAGMFFGSLLNVGLRPWQALANDTHLRCGRRWPVVEMAVGAIWGLLAWRLTDLLELVDSRLGIMLPHLNLEYTAGIMIFCLTLVGIAILDVRHFGLSSFVTLPGVAIGVLFSVVTSEQMMWFFVSEPTPWREIGQRLLSVLAAGGLVLAIRWTYWLVRRREILGWGEAHLMAMLAAWLGLPGALLAFGIGVLIGSALLLAWRAAPAVREEYLSMRELPVGALVCAGGIVSCLWGPQILALSLR